MTTTAAPPKAGTPTPDRTGAHTVLDRRRDKWQTAQQTAAAAQARVADLAEELATNATAHTDHDTALQAALTRQAELKTALKALAKDRDRLRAAHKQADRDAATARRRARAAEAKYDKALLADMLAQQKTTDLTDGTDGTDGTQSASTSQTRARTRTTPTPRRRRSAPTTGQPDDTTQTFTVAPSTPRRTTATARKART